ncbi:MAG: hypothetical protein LBP73_08890, partial [Clostridiales Family XIII bacterium]|nr:hypothetical protein [Clostridiales Family XIII bacterium]
DFDRILDTIDDHILWIKREHDWGYSVPSLMAGVFSSHPNNVSYLLKKNRLQTKDIRYILAMTDAETRKRYDYENIDRLYLAYSSSKFDDKTNLNLLKSHFKNKGVLVVVFGATSREYRTEIVRFIRENRPVVISVNHVYCAYKPDFLFYGNHRRYGSSPRLGEGIRRIITSNIPSKCDDDIVVDYSKVISLGYENYDNTTVMLLNLLRNVGVKSISIAGLDGYAREFRENYADEILSHNAPSEPYDASRNEELSALLKHFAESLTDGQTVRSITPGRFQSIFEGRST